MDLDKIRTEVYKKHGIPLDAHDPVLITALLNDIVLRHSLSTLSEHLNENNKSLNKSLEASNIQIEEKLAEVKKISSDLITQSSNHASQQIHAAILDALKMVESQKSSDLLHHSPPLPKDFLKSLKQFKNQILLLCFMSLVMSTITLSGILFLFLHLK